MKNLEKKIKTNRLKFLAVTASKELPVSKSESGVKKGFANSWDKGWGNYGKTFKPVEINAFVKAEI